MLVYIGVWRLIVMAVDGRPIKGAFKRRLRPARIPVMAVGYQQGAVAMGRTILKGDLPPTFLQRLGSSNGGLKTNMWLDVEVFSIIVEVLGNVSVMGENWIMVGHRVVGVLHALLRGIDEERFVSAGHAIGVLIEPIPTNAITRLIAVKRDAMVLENLGG